MHIHVNQLPPIPCSKLLICASGGARPIDSAHATCGCPEHSSSYDRAIVKLHCACIISSQHTLYYINVLHQLLLQTIHIPSLSAPAHGITIIMQDRTRPFLIAPRNASSTTHRHIQAHERGPIVRTRPSVVPRNAGLPKHQPPPINMPQSLHYIAHVVSLHNYIQSTVYTYISFPLHSAVSSLSVPPGARNKYDKARP